MHQDYKKMDVNVLHLTNKRILLKLIKEKKIISRSELSKETGLTPPSVTRIVDDLVQSDKLVEYVCLGNSNGGRPPVLVKFKNESNYIIGIDLGATYIRGCLVDINANFISEIQIPTEIEKGFAFTIRKVVQMIAKLQSRIDEDKKIWGVGIGVAGLINSRNNIIEFSPDFEWSNINLQEILQKEIDIPVFYDNSTRLMALGELKLGENRFLKNFVIINVGYGIAAGMVINGKLITGHNGFAGEFGHISVDTNSHVKCKCGMHGCLESLASGHRITALGKEKLESEGAKILKELCNGNPEFITAEMVANAARKGDQASIGIYDEIAEYLAKGIGIIANLLNPEVIYLGGGISFNGDLLFDLVNSKKIKYLLPQNANIQVIPSTFGDHATSIGAVSMVLERIMNLELSDSIK
jgi:glucokinase-like ROK family protein